VGTSARLGLEFGLALELLALRAAELSSGFHLAVALDVSTLHAEALPIAVGRLTEPFSFLFQARCHRWHRPRLDAGK